MNGDETRFSAFAMNLETTHPAPGGEVSNLKGGYFAAPESVVEQGGENGPVAFAFKSVVERRVKENAGLIVADGGGFPFVGVRVGTFNAADRVVGDRVLIAEVIKEGGQGRRVYAGRWRGRDPAGRDRCATR